MKQWWPLLAISLFVLSGCGPAKTASVIVSPSPVPPTPTLAQTQTINLSGSLKELLSGNKIEQCAWTADAATGRTGIIYVSGKKFRQEITVTDPKTKDVSHIYSVSDGTSIFTWGTSLGTRGVKIAFTKLESLLTNNPTAVQNRTGIDLNAQYQYQCQPWTPDDSQLTPPTGINFINL